MEDIICTVPEFCGESDCPVGVHLAHYWCYDDGTYTVCDSDGNHEGCEESDVPSFDQQTAAWAEYYQHVADTGSDPLNEISSVRETLKRRERYTARFRNSILGAVLVQVKRGRSEVNLRQLPERVAEYLCVKRTNAMSPWVFSEGRFADLLKLDGVKAPRRLKSQMPTASVRFIVEHEVPRNAHTVAAELRRAARRLIRKHAAAKSV
jgi:hypothetical protein